MAATQLENPVTPLDDGGGGGAVRGGDDGDDEDDRAQQAKTLICALNLISRNLPLPGDVSDAVSSIYRQHQSDDLEDDDAVCRVWKAVDFPLIF